MSSLWNSKSLAEWQELDYFRRPRPLKALWKPVLLTTLALAVVAMVAVAALQKKVVPRLAAIYQAGPLSPSHALFNNDCGQCHVEGFKTWDRLQHFDSTIRAVSDDTCSKCHPGPTHHPDLVQSGPHCVSCHREHHGQVPLSRVHDGDCTSCHRDLPASIEKGKQTVFRNIAAFAGHPEFVQRWEGAPKDPGTVAFNHAVHLQPDGVLTYCAEQRTKLGGTPGRLGGDAEVDRRMQREVLQCNKCHELDEAGRYMLPIRYEQHCNQCHPLTVGIPVRTDAADAKRALAEFSRTPAPHQAPEVVRAVLRDRLTQFIQANPGFLKIDSKGPEARRPIPGSKPNRPELVSKEEFEWVGRQLIQVEKPLLTSKAGCAYCHQEITPEKRKEGALPGFALSRINQRTFAAIGSSSRWFPHSRFRHDSHRLLDCTQCHDARSSRLTSDVLLPGIANCRNCHNNPASDRSLSAGSARTDCVECHAYHPADQKRAWSGRLTIETLGSRSP